MNKIRIWFLRQKLSILEYRLANFWQFTEATGSEYLREYKDVKRQITETNAALKKLEAPKK